MSQKLYLHQIKQGWYVRVAIPRPVRHFFNGKSHMIYTLKTKDLPIAQERRWVEVAKIRARIQAAKDANGDADKFKQAAVKIEALNWQQRIANKLWNVNEFVETTQRIQKAKGDAPAEEFVNRSFGIHTDLDHLEEEFFAARKLTERTKMHYRKTRRALEEHLQREGLPIALESVTKPVALSFESWLVANDFHPVTGNAYLGGLRSRFNFLISKLAYKGANPFQGVVLKAANTGEEPSRREWRPNELKILFAGDCEPELFDLMTGGLLLGARRSEIVGFKTKDYRTGFLHVTKGKSKAAIRKIPVAKLVRPVLNRMVSGLSPNDYIFLRSKSNVSIHTRGNLCGQRFERLRKSLGLTDDATVYHSLRHTFMTLADESRPRHHVRVVVGHSDKKDTTSGYTRVSDKNRVRVVQAVVKALPASVKAEISRRFGKSMEEKT